MLCSSNARMDSLMYCISSFGSSTSLSVVWVERHVYTMATVEELSSLLVRPSGKGFLSVAPQWVPTFLYYCI